MYRYFISAYIKVSEETGENGYTNFIYDSDFKLNTMERINEIKEDILKETNYAELVILYFTEIEKTENENNNDKNDNDVNNDVNEVETEEIPPDTSGMDMSNVSVDDDTEVADCEAEETEETDNANNTEDVVEDSTSTTTETE